jgi:hypothetical protein
MAMILEPSNASRYKRKRKWHDANYTPAKRARTFKLYNNNGLFRGQTQMVGSSHGYYDVHSASAEIFEASPLVHLNVIKQGPGVNERIGKKLAITSIQMRAAVWNKSTAIWNKVAIYIIHDKRPTGGVPNLADVFEFQAPGAAPAAATPLSFPRNDHHSRFEIIKGWNIVLVGPDTAGSSTARSVANIEWYKKKFIPMEYNYNSANTGDITELERGAIYLCVMGEGATGTARAQIDYAFRFRFRDQLG